MFKPAFITFLNARHMPGVCSLRQKLIKVDTMRIQNSLGTTGQLTQSCYVLAGHVDRLLKINPACMGLSNLEVLIWHELVWVAIFFLESACCHSELWYLPLLPKNRSSKGKGFEKGKILSMLFMTYNDYRKNQRKQPLTSPLDIYSIFQISVDLNLNFIHCSGKLN